MSKPTKNKALEQTLIAPILVATGVSLGLLFCRFLSSESSRYWFLAWNLILGWIPLIFAWELRNWLQRGRWLSWQGILLTGLWLSFLPNSFYVVTDFIHLRPTGEVSLLFDVVMLMSFSVNAMVLGYLSIWLVHMELNKRFKQQVVLAVLALVFILSSFAIYLGRYLAWNSWDILVNPLGIVFDITDRFIKPLAYVNTFTTTAMFSVLTSSFYFLAYRFIAALRKLNKLY